VAPPGEGLVPLVPSALLSSRWSRDNLITPDPSRLYTGPFSARVGVEQLQEQVDALTSVLGDFEVEEANLGVLSWNVRGRDRRGPVHLVLPLGIDQAGVGGRSKARVPERCFEHARTFTERRLDRYLLAPDQLVEARGAGEGACFRLPSGYLPLTFGLGRVRVDVVGEDGAWGISLGARSTREILVELCAAMAYHYDLESGTMIADVVINDGDFLVRRDRDGSFALRWTTARTLESGVGPERFLLYLMQLMAYEDWEVDGDLLGLPVPLTDPEAAFAGFTRGRRLRCLDLGEDPARGVAQAQALLDSFARSREGRAYRPWVERYRDPHSSPALTSDDPRRPWWNLVELRQRRDRLRLERGEDAAAPLSTLIERLLGVVGVAEPADAGTAPSVNDVDRREVLDLLESAGVRADARASAADTWFESWPYRSRAELEARLPGLAALPPSRLLCPGVAPAEEEGTLAALDRWSRARPARELANPELFGGRRLAPDALATAVSLLPSFEAFMDDALHDPRWGYYANRVVIGREGHFSTHPENLTPHYGRWVAAWAFEAWRELCASGKLRRDEPFSLVEFGAGNGRLARDVLDAVRSLSGSSDDWRRFREVLEVRIYEISDPLRKKQQALLGADARVLVGDARAPADCLRRDFPEGLVGLVVTNELPDAFGVHKVRLSASGDAEAVLVVSRIEPRLLEALRPELRDACRQADVRLRQLLGERRHGGELLLDRSCLGDLMAALYQLPAGQREPLIDQVWFDEVLVPAACFGSLAEVLRRGASEMARALAAEPSGVITYVNVHATRFIGELAKVLRLGQVLTIDYGDTTWGLIQGARQGQFPFRIYCDEGSYLPRPNTPYSRPGAQDLTADVNFTDLSLAAREAGLEHVYFGPERAIAGREFPRVLASTDQRPFAELVGNSVFKLLVVGRGVSYFPELRGIEPLPLLAHAPGATLDNGSTLGAFSGMPTFEELRVVFTEKSRLLRGTVR
jgi:SAM-dependent MidA family methyltransferase